MPDGGPTDVSNHAVVSDAVIQIPLNNDEIHVSGLSPVDIDTRVRTALADVCQLPVVIRTGLPVPGISAERIRASRDLCAQNRCGCYDTSWTCPPHCPDPETCASSASVFTRCVLMHRRYNARADDSKRVRSVLHAFQETCRNARRALEMNGIGCLVMAGGPCTYCAKCAVSSGAPCRYPERQIPSMSVYGVDIFGYLEENGLTVEQPEGTLTLFGIILY